MIKPAVELKSSARAKLPEALYGLLLLALILNVKPESVLAQQEITADIRLMGADLVDELVYGWQEAPPVGEKATLVLAGVHAPLGLDSRFNEMVENRLYELLRQNPGIAVDLAYCGPCTQLVAKSNPSGTLLSRGIDQPEVLENLMAATPGRMGLVLNFEAEGQDLVLRAYIFDFGKQQKILWARMIPTSMTARRMLRESTPLISLAAARERQWAILNRRDPLEVTSRLAVRMFLSGANANVASLPLPFFEQSFEAVPFPNRSLRSGFTLGFTSIQRSLSAWSVGGHVSGLILRDTPSLVSPDLYWLIGAHYIRMRGPGAAAFAETQPDLETLLRITDEPKATLVAWRVGLETHIKHRMGLLLFLEDIPLLKDNTAFDRDYLLGIPYFVYGFGVLIRW